MKEKAKVLAASFIALGATSISAQILVLRELLKAFYGNELSIAVILGSWLLLISVGSLALGKFADRIKNEVKHFSCLLIVLSIATPASLLLCRMIRPALGINPGEIIGLTAVLASSLVALCVFCIPYGFLFALGCRIYARFFREQSEGVGEIFFSEAAGAVIGGSIVSLILLGRITPYQIAFLFSALNLAFAFILPRILEPKRPGFAAYLSLGLLAISLLAWPAGAIDRIDAFSERLAWRPFRLLKSEDSIYGNISVIARGSQINFYSNNLFLFSAPDKLTSEETVHYALLSHPCPKSVLLVGGGIGGALDELYQYDLTAIDYVELDPLLIKVAEEVMGESLKVRLKNPVLRIIEGDGRLHIKTTDRAYDIIILSAPDPHTIQINRLYTMEFFKEVKKRLKEGGILSVTCEANENYIGPEMAEYIRSIYKTLKETGFAVAIIPGETVRFLASLTDAGLPAINAGYFQKMLDKKGVETDFVRDYYLNSKLSPGRTAYANRIITDTKYSPVNTDFKPISYYHGVILWAAYFQPGLRRFFGFLNERRLWYSLLFIYALLLIFYTTRKSKNRAVFIAIGTTGFSEMAIEINIMLAFQIIYGYLYYKLGLIITFFMAGLFAGAYLTTKRLGQIKLPLATLKKTKIALGLVSFLLIPVFKALSARATISSAYIGANLAFPLLMFITGAIGGMQFPIANKIILGRKPEVGKVAGSLYGTDMIGAMLGALLVATVFIPIIGIFQCLIAVGVLNIISSIIIRPEANPVSEARIKT